jgi:hypothetical protein
MLDALRRGTEVRRDKPFSVPNNESWQKDRFLDAMKDRNDRYSAYCRPEFNHVCDLCGKEGIRDGEQGKMLYWKALDCSEPYSSPSFSCD